MGSGIYERKNHFTYTVYDCRTDMPLVIGGTAKECAADRIEQMAETIAYARTIQAERDAMAAYLKSCGCDTCKHEHCDVDAEPCESCIEGENVPAWEWKGE